MKKVLSNPFFVLLLIAAIAAVAIIFFRAREPAPNVVSVVTDSGTQRDIQVKPTGNTDDLRDSLKKLDALNERWSDAVRLASSTPRIGLAPLVKDLQDQTREANALAPTLPPCLQTAMPYLHESQQATVDGLLAFMRQEADSIVQEKTDTALRAVRNYKMVVEGCKPAV